MIETKWEQIILLDTHVLPPYPIESFNGAKWLQDFIGELSEETQTDEALAGTNVLSVLATCLQNKYIVEVKAGYTETLNIYTITAMAPSERKTGVFTKIVKPIKAYENDVNTENESLIKQNIQEKYMLTKKIEYQQKLVVKDGKGSQMAELKRRELQEKLDNFIDIKRVNLTADDVTPEKLAALMCENQGNMSIMSSEGGIVGTISGRYNKNGNANIDILLKSYTGEDVKIDRQSHESRNIPSPALSIGLSMQPVVLNSFLENKEMRDKGLVSRFLYCTPPSKMGAREYDTKPITAATNEKYFSNIQILLKIPYAKSKYECQKITLSDSAKESCAEMFYKIEKKLPNELDFLKDWAGKLHGQISRIATLLHFAESIDKLGDVMPFDISRETYQRAVKLGEYYLQHALNVMGSCSANEDTSNGLYLVDKLKKKVIHTIRQRDLHEMVKGKLSKEELENTLKTLEENNYIRAERVGKSNQISVNPQLFENIENKL